MSSPSRDLPAHNESFFSFAGKLALAAAAVVAARKIVLLRANQKVAELQDKVVLITGGSRGLGLAMAHDLGRQGSRLALCARDAGELKDAVEQLSQEGIEAVPFACDVTNQSEIAALVQQVIERFGSLDVLVNNAGLIKVAPFESMQHVDYENAMNLMFWAPVNLTLAVLPQMKKQGGGHIVNISSVGGRVSIPHLLPYSCAKFALVGFSTGLSSELKTEGIHVLTVTPGLMRTGSYLNAEFSGEAQAEFAWFGLLGNLPGFSVAADFAAASIRRAIQTHRYTCTISLPAKILIGLEGLLPEASRMLCTVASEVLPYAGAGSSTAGKTLDSRFGKIFQALTLLGKRAALSLNE